jgi:hypothetical protein
VAFLGGAQEGTASFFDGYLDDLRVFHDVLTPADVAELGRTQSPLYGTQRRVEYAYDAFDRRVKKAIDDNFDGDYADTNDAVWQYVYDGQDITEVHSGNFTWSPSVWTGQAVSTLVAVRRRGARRVAWRAPR